MQHRPIVEQDGAEAGFNAALIAEWRAAQERERLGKIQSPRGAAAHIESGASTGERQIDRGVVRLHIVVKSEENLLSRAAASSAQAGVSLCLACRSCVLRGKFNP